MIVIGAVLIIIALYLSSQANKLAANYRQEEDGSGLFNVSLVFLIAGILLIGYGLIN